MKPGATLLERSGGKCELCGAEGELNVYEVAIPDSIKEDNEVVLCSKCERQVEKKEDLDATHLQCLTNSMWSEAPAVQVLSWRMLNRLRNESWAAESLDMMYLDDDRLAWAKSTGDHDSDGTVDLHRDCNGTILEAGDTITLIKSLDVKGTSLNAKMGTVVKNIRLVPDNTEQIEGKIEGQVIVILTKYVRKQAG
jgi:protein PhnA